MALSGQVGPGPRPALPAYRNINDLNRWGQQNQDRKTKSQETWDIQTSALPVLTVSVVVTLVPHAW